MTRGDLQIAGDAAYGPLPPDGTRDEGADFNDYLGLRWLYPNDAPDRPEADQYRCLDCSGYMPRRSFELYAGATGIILIPNIGTQVADLDLLDVGDLVFFDVESDDGARLDHVGMYLGTDAAGAHRFVSSRATAHGPTFADAGGRSILDGTGTYARRFRGARRL
jgi:cell wall-associated NlpC family hydrolase